MKRILFNILCLLTLLFPLKLWAQDPVVIEDAEPYAAFTGYGTNGLTLTFYYDDQKEERDGMDIGPFADYDNRPWGQNQQPITEVGFDASFADYTRLTSTAYWFASMSELYMISGIENLNTDNVTDMSQMFAGCSNLTSIDLSRFNTSNVTDMMYMFAGCESLTTIYVGSGWDISKVTNGEGMFAECVNLKGGEGTGYTQNRIGLDFAHVDGGPNNPGYFTYQEDIEGRKDELNGRIGELYEMLEEIEADLQEKDPNKAAEELWESLDQLREDLVILSEILQKALDTEDLDDCEMNIDELEERIADLEEEVASYGETDAEPYAVLSNNNSVLTFYYDSNKDAYRNAMSVGPFGVTTNDGAVERGWNEARQSITSVVIDRSFANYEELTSTAFWFKNLSSLTEISGLENLNMSNVTNPSEMFWGCASLTSLDLSSWNTANFGYMSGMFYSCTNLTTLDLSGWNLGNAGYMTYMFNFCSNLRTIYVDDNWTLPTDGSLTGWQDIFNGCESLVGGRGTTYDPDNVHSGYAHIDGGENNPGYFTDKNAPVPYAVLSDNNTVLTFYYDTKKEDRNGMSVGPFTYDGQTSWYNNSSTISTVVFDNSFAECTTLTSTAWWFYDCNNLTSITGISNLKTENVTDIRAMFRGCSSLSSIDVSGFNTSKVVDFSLLFRDCSSLSSIDVTNFNTENAIEMSSMFDGCIGLASLDLSKFNTAKVTDMHQMFNGCLSLTTVYVGDGWTTTSVVEEWAGTQMFKECTALIGGMGTTYDADHIDVSYAHIDGGENNPGYFTDKNAPVPYAVLSDNNTVLTFYYDTKKEERNGMSVGPFYYYYEENDQGQSILKDTRIWTDYANNITTVVFDNSFADCMTLTSTAIWFDECHNLSTINGIEYLKTDNVTDMQAMFANCMSLTSIDVSGFNTNNVTDFWWMFQGCSNLKEIDVRGFNTANAKNMSHMFQGCSSLTSLDVSGFNTSNVTDMSYMFYGCNFLNTIYGGDGWDTSNVSDGTYMFDNCYNLAVANGTSYDAKHVDYSYAHIDGGENNPGYFTDKNALEPIINTGDRRLVRWCHVNGKTYELYKSVDMSSSRVNPDYSYNYRTTLTLDVISNADTVRYMVDNGTIYTNADIGEMMCPTMLIDTEGNKIYIFSNSKTATVDYGMYGFVYSSALDQPAFTREVVFSANWGWFSYFSGLNSDGQPILKHWSSAGYYDMTSVRLENGKWQNTTGAYTTREDFRNTHLNMRPVMVVGNAYHDELEVDGVVYTIINGKNAYVTWIKDRSNITEVTIPETVTDENNTLSVTGIAPFAFYGCVSTRKLIIPASVNLIGESALYMSGVSDILSMSTIPPAVVNKYSFDGVNKSTSTVYVPDESIELYNNASGWSEFKNIVGLHTDLMPYAVLSDNNTVLTFYFDDLKLIRNGLDINSENWTDQASTITSVVFDDSFANCNTITSTADWFHGCNNLTSIIGINNFNTENVTNMRSMFYGCSGLTSLDLSNFNVSNVMYMDRMFRDCSSLTSLDLSNFNTSNTTSMRYMFYGCSELTTIYAGDGWSTAQVTSSDDMFNGCTNLVGGRGTTYDADHIDVSYAHIDGGQNNPGYFTAKEHTNVRRQELSEQLVNIGEMLQATGTKLQEKDPNGVATELWQRFEALNNTLEVVAEVLQEAQTEDDLDDCERKIDELGAAVTDLWEDVENYGVETETIAYGVLSNNMTKLTLYYDQNISSHDEGLALTWEDMLDSHEMMRAREMLTTIDIDTSFVHYTTLTSTNYLFAGCMNLTAINGLQNLVTDNMTDMREMFASCERLTVLDLSTFNTSHVTTMWGMFQGCSSLATIIVGEGWTTAAVTDEGHEMFAGCTSLVGGMGTTYSNAHFDYDYAHVDGGPNNPGYFTGAEGPVITEFEVDGIIYWVHDQGEHRVTVAHVMYAQERLYVPSMVEYARVKWNVTALGERAFTDLHETKSIEIPASIDSVSVNLFDHCPHLAAIQWGANVPLTSAAMGQFNNPNLLLYITNISNAPSGVTNVIDMQTRTAEQIVLSDAAAGGNDFYCPEPFMVKEISYTHSYEQDTKIGTCQGWESIVVPFDVQTFTHESKGEIYPIASLLDEQIELDGDKPFWLYTFTSNDEFVEADKIMANRPYIISMPNDSAYWDSYILKGRVTFSAKNIEVYPTEQSWFIESQERVFMANYVNEDYMNPDIYLLNVGDAYEGHLPGSVFSSERSNRKARPFEAYFLYRGEHPVKRYMDIFDKNTDAIREIIHKSEFIKRNGVYDLTGRRVMSNSSSTRPLPKGVYIIDGKKVLVK